MLAARLRVRTLRATTFLQTTNPAASAARSRPASSVGTRANIMTSAPDVKEVKFGPFEVTKQVFCVTPRSFALVNLKPIVPGHVLVCPLTPHQRLTDLSPAETADLFTTVQLMQRVLARTYFKDQGGVPSSGSFTVAVQDGPDSGQTVPHLHVHVIPRTKGDLGDAMDEIYVKMAGEEGNVGGALWDVAKRPVPGGGMPRIEDVNRNVRTPEQMHEEADRYRATLQEMYEEERGTKPPVSGERSEL